MIYTAYVVYPKLLYQYCSFILLFLKQTRIFPLCSRSKIPVPLVTSPIKMDAKRSIPTFDFLLNQTNVLCRTNLQILEKFFTWKNSNKYELLDLGLTKVFWTEHAFMFSLSTVWQELTLSKENMG